VIGALTLELNGQLRDLKLELVDQLEAGVEVAPPRVGDRQPVLSDVLCEVGVTDAA
jgi:hypothetical protein